MEFPVTVIIDQAGLKGNNQYLLDNLLQRNVSNSRYPFFAVSFPTKPREVSPRFGDILMHSQQLPGCCIIDLERDIRECGANNGPKMQKRFTSSSKQVW